LCPVRTPFIFIVSAVTNLSCFLLALLTCSSLTRDFVGSGVLSFFLCFLFFWPWCFFRGFLFFISFTSAPSCRPSCLDGQGWALIDCVRAASDFDWGGGRGEKLFISSPAAARGLQGLGAGLDWKPELLQDSRVTLGVRALVWAG